MNDQLALIRCTFCAQDKGGAGGGCYEDSQSPVEEVTKVSQTLVSMEERLSETQACLEKPRKRGQ